MRYPQGQTLLCWEYLHAFCFPPSLSLACTHTHTHSVWAFEIAVKIRIPQWGSIRGSLPACMLWAAQYEILVVKEYRISMTLFVWATDTLLCVCAFPRHVSLFVACTAKICFRKDKPYPHSRDPNSDVWKAAFLFKTWAHQFLKAYSLICYEISLYYTESFFFFLSQQQSFKIFSSKLTLSSEKLLSFCTICL